MLKMEIKTRKGKGSISIKTLQYLLCGGFGLYAITGLIFGYIACYMLVSVVAYLSPWMPLWMWYAEIGLFLHAVALAATSVTGVIAVLAQKLRGIKVCSYILGILLVIELAVTVQMGTRRDSLNKAIQFDLMSSMEVSEEYYSMNISDSQMWDEIQIEMNCCGVNSYKDWFNTPFGNGENVPDTCCLLVHPECGQNIAQNIEPSDDIIIEGCLPVIMNVFEEKYYHFGFSLWLPAMIIQTIMIIFIMYIRRHLISCNVSPYMISSGFLQVKSPEYTLLKEPWI